jgi:hypothetical protein
LTPEEQQALRDQMTHLNRISNAADNEDGTYMVCWILERCGFLDPVFVGNSGIYKNATLSDFANELFAELVKANPVLGHKVLDHFINSYRGDEAEIRRALNGR